MSKHLFLLVQVYSLFKQKWPFLKPMYIFVITTNTINKYDLIQVVLRDWLVGNRGEGDLDPIVNDNNLFLCFGSALVEQGDLVWWPQPS